MTTVIDRYGPSLAEGKTKILYASPDRGDGTAFMVHKDAITAGDGAKRDVIADKGELSCRTTTAVFRYLHSRGVATHYVDTPDARVMRVLRADMIPIEWVARRLATGSYVRRTGVAEGTRFEPPILELFLKDDARHDPQIAERDAVTMGLLSDEELEAALSTTMRVFLLLEEAWARQDVQLVDLKIEFGRTDRGLMVADVIDNDSWRLWPGGRREEMLDKQVYRNLTSSTPEALEDIRRRYVEVAARTEAFLDPDAASSSMSTRVASPLVGDPAPSRFDRGENAGAMNLLETGRPAVPNPARAKVRDECGVVGIHSPDAASLAVLGLHALQHRGQESAGVASFDGDVHMHKGMGLVDQVFTEAPHLPGVWAVGHNRYSTCGTSIYANAGPFRVDTDLGPLVLAHNGNIVNAPSLRLFLAAEYGLEPESDSDSELLALLLKAAPNATWPERIAWMAQHARGSYALVLLTGNRLIGVRDPMGNRPLALGRLEDGWTLASESCAFSVLGGHPVRDLKPGEILEIDVAGPRPPASLPLSRSAFCVFEYIYIARPDTLFAGRPVHSIRRSIGEQLGYEQPASADLVIGVPDSGTSAALGYATATGIPFGEGLIKNRYVGRTFIQPAQAERERLIRMKFGALPLHGRRVVLVDDSIVRGNTLRPIVALLREHGASQIHVRIAAPPLTDPCFLGVDMASREELVANRLDEEALAAHVGADSLRYVSVDGLLRAVRGSRADHCLACFTGQYPIKLDNSLKPAGQAAGPASRGLPEPAANRPEEVAHLLETGWPA